MTSVELAREWLKLRQRVEELERENTLLHGDLQAAEAKLERMIAAEAKLAKVVDAGDNLQREARVVAVPGTGHLIDAIEMWTSAVLAAARGE